MIQFIIAAALLGLVVYALLPPEKRSAWGRQALIWGGAGFLLLLLVTGRLHWLFAVLAGLFPLARRLLPLIRAWPWVKRWLAGRTASAGGDDHHLRGRLVTLILDNGDIVDGEIHASPWEGQRLNSMNLDALRELHQYCQSRDQASAALLRAFLDRRHGQAWHPGGASSVDAGAITREEACAILAVPPDADAGTITAAHRRLMQRMHPDRGGSDYLASRINAAKRRLLGS